MILICHSLETKCLTHDYYFSFSGTSFMYGPPGAVSSLYSKIPGAATVDAEHGIHSFPCSSPPSVSFSWGGKSWAISAAK